MNTVKGALASGTASAGTVTTLQSLLNLGQPEGAVKASKTETRVNGSRTRPKYNGAKAVSKTRPVPLLEDAAPNLSSRDQHILATEVVNISLKILTTAAKAAGRVSARDCARRPEEASSRPSTPLRRALDPRSGNATPRRPSPDDSEVQKKAFTSELANTTAVRPGPVEISATAECAHIGFSYLCSIDAKGLGVREIPRLQLENGMLALVGRLITLGHDALAIKELQAVKRRLECTSCPDSAGNSSVTRPRDVRQKKETLSRLLKLDLGADTHPELLSVAVLYQRNVIQAMSVFMSPAVIENAVQYLSPQADGSPTNIMLQQEKTLNDRSKAAKQIEALSHAILALCPGVSTSHDEAATDPCRFPSPESVFQLQTISLQLRQSWNELTNDDSSQRKDLADRLSKCVMAFVRRSAGMINPKDVFDKVSSAVAVLGHLREDESARNALFTTHHVLCSLADQAGMTEQAQYWAHQMEEDTKHLADTHAQKLSGHVQNAIMKIRTSLSMESSSQSLGDIDQAVDSASGGTSADFETLLTSLAGLSNAVLALDDTVLEEARRLKVLGANARFALRFAKSYPGRRLHNISAILDAASSMSKSADDILTWVSVGAVKVFIQQGTVKTIAETAASRPMLAAWSISKSSNALSRVIRALQLRFVRSMPDPNTSGVFDDECLCGPERGALLELQLHYALELAVKPKYHKALRKSISEALQKLSTIYDAAGFPVRRGRVCNVAIHVNEDYPDLIPAEILSPWSKTFDLGPSELGQDAGLSGFLEDVRAALSVSRHFQNGLPCVSDLNDSLLIWQDILKKCKTKEEMESRVDDHRRLKVQLISIEAYLAVLGEDVASLAARKLSQKIAQLSYCDIDDLYLESADLSRRYLSLGLCEKAKAVLMEAEKHERSSVAAIVILKHQVTHAEVLLACDELDACREFLDGARNTRAQCVPEQVTKSRRHLYEAAHVQCWLVQSEYSFRIGSPHEALNCAKRAVRLLNSMWTAIERSTKSQVAGTSVDASESPEPVVNGLVDGISKLQLTSKPNPAAKGAEQPQKGAVFWPIIPILLQALMHLSDMYVHHGLYHEANYYSERALNFAVSAGPSALALRVRSHRAHLLAVSGRLEEAELSLALDDHAEADKVSLDGFKRSSARAFVKSREGSLEDADMQYKDALKILDILGSEEYLQDIENSTDVEHFIPATKNEAVSKPTVKSRARAGDKNELDAANSNRSIATKAKNIKTSTSTRSKPTSIPRAEAAASSKPHHLISKWRFEILLKRALICVSLGSPNEILFAEIGKIQLTEVYAGNSRELIFSELMRKAFSSLRTDVTLNIVSESTISIPGIDRTEEAQCDSITSRNFQKSLNIGLEAIVQVSQKQSRTSKTSLEKEYVGFFMSAKSLLFDSLVSTFWTCGTCQAHREMGNGLNVSLLLSAISPFKTIADSPIQPTLNIDLSRIKSLQFEQQAMQVDASCSDNPEPFEWPNSGSFPVTSETTTSFQEKYIDILPPSWTAVSICLSEDCSRLYAARYRSGQTPFVIMLPFSRHKSEGVGEEERVLDYYEGKAELQDIIELSNYSCHSGSNPEAEAKGARTKWWGEREALDRRLQELLINIENIWFGGFKAVLSQHMIKRESFARFRKAIGEILNRHLPSRKVSKGRDKQLNLDEQVIELFTGLRHDHDSTVDLDDPVTDLLYFIVDMLQFNGERNAYDEIDFDSMTIDVLDALRVYHEESSSIKNGSTHLILVLDRRLQAFPWESMPCLEDANVSRVGSMLTLRESILTMRKSQRACPKSRPEGLDQHKVSRNSGAYILNPGSDLKGTQTTLEPVLSAMTISQESNWCSIVKTEPTEEAFSAALTTKPMLLYFGHGAGTQYIRPRTIRRLHQCSEVVWLMGCSSGAVAEHGDLEPSAVPLTYLLAGRQSVTESPSNDPVRDEKEKAGKCLSVVATLWDVTDKDIDRFSITVGEEWGLWPTYSQEKLPSKTPKKKEREMVAAPATPQQVPKTPKTPKIRKTPAATKTPVRSRAQSKRKKDEKVSLVEAVARSRDACYLRFLNGAAPVVYGIPVYLGD